MAGLVVLGVCRYTVHGTYAGRNIANIIDMSIAPVVPTTRTEAIADQAARIIDAWANNICPRVTEDYNATLLTWVDLNSSTGEVGSATEGLTDSFPSNGDITSAAFPGNVAVRANKVITAARGQRKGRMYFVGANESITADGAPNTIGGADVALWNTALDDFLDDVNVAPGGTPDYNSAMVVIHTHVEDPGPPPVIEVDGTSFVDGLVVDATLASQRRRLRG